MWQEVQRPDLEPSFVENWLCDMGPVTLPLWALVSNISEDNKERFLFSGSSQSRKGHQVKK